MRTSIVSLLACIAVAMIACTATHNYLISDDFNILLSNRVLNPRTIMNVSAL